MALTLEVKHGKASLYFIRTSVILALVISSEKLYKINFAMTNNDNNYINDFFHRNKLILLIFVRLNCLDQQIFVLFE